MLTRIDTAEKAIELMHGFLNLLKPSRTAKEMLDWSLLAIKTRSYAEDEAEAVTNLEKNILVYGMFITLFDRVTQFSVDVQHIDFISNQQKIIATLMSGIVSPPKARMFGNVSINLMFSPEEIVLCDSIIKAHSICTLIQMQRFLSDADKKILIVYAVAFVQGNIKCQSYRHALPAMVMQSLVEIFELIPSYYRNAYFSSLFFMMCFFEKDFKESAFNFLKKIAEKINFSLFKFLVTETFSTYPTMLDLMEQNKYFEKVNSFIFSLQLKEAIKCYMPLAGQAKNVERAYELFIEIPASEKNAYIEAHYFLAKIACFESEFTPADFKTETNENKEKRLLAMRPYLAVAAEGGYELAVSEKALLDTELEKLRAARIANNFFQPAIASVSVSSVAIVTDEKEKVLEGIYVGNKK